MIPVVLRTTQTYIGLNVIEPFDMALLNVLAPKGLAFEEFSALWYLASKFRLVLLLDEFLELFI